MASEIVIENAEQEADLTLNGTVKRGDPLAHDGTNWVQADASDAVTNLYAQYIAMQGGVSGDNIKGCKRGVLYDEDAPWTANGAAYVSATAGAITQTRPTANGDVVQVIGRAISTKRLAFEIASPHEVEEFYQTGVYNQGTGTTIEALVRDDTTGEWSGPDVDAAAIAAVFAGWFPSNMIGAPKAADLIVNTQAATALDVDVTFRRAYIDQTNTGDAGDTKTGLTTGITTADNLIQKVSIVAGMDADYAKAGAPWSVLIDPDGGDFILVGLYLRYEVV